MTLLKLQSPMMHGPNVVRLQELGDLLGYDTGANDGIFGRDTEKAVLLIQAKLGLKVDGIAGPITWRSLLDYVDKLSSAGKVVPSGIETYDIRGMHPLPKLYGKPRTWADIDGVLLHQCGCNMPQQPKGWGRLNAQSGTTHEGKFVIVNDPKDMIHHAQGLSKSTIGHEIEGNFRGVQSDPKTLWKGGGEACNLNLAMKLSLDDTFDHYRDEFRRNGAKWTTIHAHRQSSASRRADPGSEIWQNVAMVWAERLDLKNYDGGPTWCKPKGLVIPVRWNPEYDGRY